MKLIIDFCLWISSHLLSIALTICVLFGAHLFINVFVPQWQQEYDRLGGQLKQLEEDKQDLGEEMETTGRLKMKTRLHLEAIKARSLPHMRKASEVVARYRGTVSGLSRGIALKQKALDDYARSRVQQCHRVCGWLGRALSRISGSEACEKARRGCLAAREGYQQTKGALEVARKQLVRARARVSTAVADLDRLKKRFGAADDGLMDANRRLTAHQQDEQRQLKTMGKLDDRVDDVRKKLVSSAMGKLLSARAFLWSEFKKAILSILLIVLGVIMMPIVWKAFWFYLMMPKINRRPPLRLSLEERGQATVTEARGSLEVPLEQGRPLAVRASWLVGVGDGPGRVVRRTRIFWRTGSPFVSYAASLFLLTELQATGAGPGASTPDGDPDQDDSAPTRTGQARAVIAPQRDPDMYICRLELTDHPGFVIHPRHVVGIMGDIQLKRRWRIFSLHALATRQVRFLMFSGTGTVFLTGRGGVTAMEAEQAAMKLEEQAVAGFDGRLAYRSVRTETFLPYLLGRTALVDDTFEGKGLFLREGVTGADVRVTPMERGVNGVLAALGKFLGF